ncbi:(d)CMP kinase [Cryobacterium sp. TMT1-3]|uniref:Cytidylate kinase n=1 Tax=Cryobacterium luteum TaxID=1424661 RepID=A0A1H8JPR6_9MICO|nr:MULTISPECIES: (d)CMP kinase [Cryobacterium]TFB83893.1 (d)CMP kinase [Cryobacterium luteum]TFC31952.1 (d)CMP kinase [Cryobacterium sp. TMT1-3]SEN82326.1 cytidylate kinase [Cryobacterium luteum]
MARHSLPTVVAIDGPAGSGKSSVSRAIARRLGFAYLDTGAAYRALAWLALDRHTDSSQADAVTALLKDFDYAIGTDPDEYFVTVGQTDVTDAIRSPEVSAAVSAVARVPEVRRALTDLFRSIAENVDRPGVVVEGRDITTIVAPEAEVRILLTASEEARMARRSAEITTQSAQTVAEQLRSRDRADSQVVDFMSAADGVITVDSTHLDFEQTIEAVIDVYHTRMKQALNE